MTKVKGCEIELCKANLPHRLGAHSNWCKQFAKNIMQEPLIVAVKEKSTGIVNLFEFDNEEDRDGFITGISHASNLEVIKTVREED